jgi:hypothetical protein
VFKRFVSWIRFVRPKISKGLIRFVSEGLVYESRILTLNTCQTYFFTAYRCLKVQVKDRR